MDEDLLLVLPAPCPAGCGAILQRCLQPGLGVTPHYDLLHPEEVAPKVAER